MVNKFTYMGFTASEVWLNSGSLTYCYVLALSLQIQDYCLLCDMQETPTFAQAEYLFLKTVTFRTPKKVQSICP